jgi:S-adenosylmethionine hydrolase
VTARNPDAPSPYPGPLALLTDFGSDHWFAGVLRGVLAREAPGVPILDLTHSVPGFDARAGSYILGCAAPYFPEGSVFVCVVDPGVGSERDPLVLESRGRAFIGPDNGLFSHLLAEDPGARARLLDLRSAGPLSRTFHGRDLFAPAAARLVRGARPEDLGPPVTHLQRLEVHGPQLLSGGLQGEVEMADSFGNLLTNVRRDHVRHVLGGEAEAADEPPWEVILGEHRLQLGETYASARPGEALALWNSWDHLEVAVREGSAAEALGAGPGSRVLLRRKAGE